LAISFMDTNLILASWGLPMTPHLVFARHDSAEAISEGQGIATPRQVGDRNDKMRKRVGTRPAPGDCRASLAMTPLVFDYMKMLRYHLQ
jgi:hypothetical protein